MRLSISNIAWDVGEDTEVATLLANFGLDAIDIAPGKYFPNPASATEDEIKRVKGWWKDRGVEIIGMQALLFGTTGLNVFGNPDVQKSMLAHLESVSRIGGLLGATKLTFGSPKNRDRAGLSDEETLEKSAAFFTRLGDLAQAHGVTFCLEPNPPQYGANFMTTSAETAQVVKAVGHPAIRMQFDSGAVRINGDDVGEILQSYAPLIGHIHLSEPDLKPLGDCGTDHASIHAALEKYLPGTPATIEMVATKDEPHLNAIKRALSSVISAYGENGQTRNDVQ